MMDKAELRAALKKAEAKPMSCVVGLDGQGQAVILLDRHKGPRKLLAEVRARGRMDGLDLDPASLRRGRVSVSGGEAAYGLNKAVPPPVKQAMKAPMRAAGFPQFTVNADPAIEDEPDEEEGGGGGVVQGVPGQAPAAGRAAPPPAAASPPRAPVSAVVPPDVAEGIRAAMAADPLRRPELVRLLAQARAGVEGGDPGAAEAGLAALRQAVGDAANAPGGRNGDAGATPGAGRVPFTPAAPATGPLPGPAVPQPSGGAGDGCGARLDVQANQAPVGQAPAIAQLAGAVTLPAAGATLAVGGVTAAETGVAGWAASPAARAAAIAVFEAAPEVAVAVAVVVLVVWMAKYGPIKTVPVAGFQAGTPGVAPISAEVNGTRHSVMLYHGPATSAPDLAYQHSVTLRVGDDGTLTDRLGRAVARLGEGEIMPLPGVDVPGLFHGDTATPPVSEQPLADETPDGRRDGTGWVDQPPPRSATAPPVPDLSGARVNLGLVALSAPPDGLRGALGGDGGFTPAPPMPPLPGLVPPPPVVPTSTANPAPPPAVPTSTATPIPDGPVVPPHTGGTTPVLPPGMNVVESQADPGLTRPTGPIGGVPTGLRARSEQDAPSEDKAQVDSENQVTDAMAAAGYRTVQRPTEGTNPALTPERLQAEGLRPGADPDLLVEDRVWDIYTPENDDPMSVRDGIQRKVDRRQTHRVVVDLRGIRQTIASVRAAIRATPLRGVREVIFYTEDGLSPPFRP